MYDWQFMQIRKDYEAKGGGPCDHPDVTTERESYRGGTPVVTWVSRPVRRIRRGGRLRSRRFRTGGTAGARDAGNRWRLVAF